MRGKVPVLFPRPVLHARQPALPAACSGTTALPASDAALLVVDKPAGLLTVPGRGPDKQDCLLTRVRADFPDAEIVHRLDMATSGLVVFARGLLHEKPDARLCRARGRQALCGRGGQPPASKPRRHQPAADHRLAQPPAAGDRRRNRQAFTDAVSGAGQPDGPLAMQPPATGAGHQPHRTNCAYIWMPSATPSSAIPLYGAYASQSAAPRLLLHAEHLALPHPDNGEACTGGTARPRSELPVWLLPAISFSSLPDSSRQHTRQPGPHQG